MPAKSTPQANQDATPGGPIGSLVSLDMIEDVLRNHVFAVVDPKLKGDDVNSGTELSDLVNSATPVARAYYDCLKVLAEARAKGDRSGAKKFKTPRGMLSLSEIIADAEELRQGNEFWTNALFSTAAETVADFRLKMLAAIGVLTPNSLKLEKDAETAQEPFPAAFMVLTTICDVFRLFVANGDDGLPIPTLSNPSPH